MDIHPLHLIHGRDTLLAPQILTQGLRPVKIAQLAVKSERQRVDTLVQFGPQSRRIWQREVPSQMIIFNRWPYCSAIKLYGHCSSVLEALDLLQHESEASPARAHGGEFYENGAREIADVDSPGVPFKGFELLVQAIV